MYRRAMNNLVEWKKSSKHKPLVISGARQVGKTWLMQEFGNQNYQNVCYINMDNNERMEALFNGSFDINRIIMALQIEAEVTIDANNTLIIFDEVQEVPRALSALKYFHENAPQYDIVAAGSLLGVAMHPGTSFPVGKVDFLDLYPLDFLEFIAAMGRDDLVNLIESQDFELVKNFKSLYIELLKQYFYTGGMPEVVKSFVDNRDYAEVRKIQNRLLAAYEQDLSKHAPGDIIPRIRMLWKSIPAQLAKENRKFIYRLIKQGARARDYELAMTWLVDCGLVYRIYRVTKPGTPLAAYQDLQAFKLFILDVGLLGAMSELDLKTIINGSRVFEEFKGALTEQFVLQQLVAMERLTPYYWSASSGESEVDFMFQISGNVVPLEVKAAENLMAKSLQIFRNKYSSPLVIRTSLSDYRLDKGLLNIPLYAVGILPQLLADHELFTP